MTGKKTSVEQTRDEEKLAQVGNMLDAAFGDVGGLQAPVDAETEEPTPGPEEEPPNDRKYPVPLAPDNPYAEENHDATADDEPADGPAKPSGPPSGPPSEPPSGPPSGPPGCLLYTSPSPRA